MKQNAKETSLVEAFVRHLGRAYGDLDLQLEAVPDEEAAGDIDGIAGRFAVEHTSIDSYPDQRTNASFFARVAGPLEGEIQPKRHVVICVPHNEAVKGRDFAELTAALRRWITVDCAALAEGVHAITDAPGLPFRLRVEVSHRLPPGLRFRRSTPREVPGELARLVRSAIERKASKLTKYRAAGRTTVLLLESRDIALMNEPTMRQAVQQAFPEGPPHVVDQVWYAETYPGTATTFHEFTTHGKGLAN